MSKEQHMELLTKFKYPKFMFLLKNTYSFLFLWFINLELLYKKETGKMLNSVVAD